MATVLDLTPEERMHYLRHAKLPPPAPLSPQQEARRTTLRHQAQEAATRLKARFTGIRVLLFGSLAHQAWWTDHSDIDLALQGLAEADFWEAWRLAEAAIRESSVDLVLYESAHPSLQQAIDREGVEL